MNRRLLASIVGIGVVGLTSWAHAQAPKAAATAPPSAAAFAPTPAAPPAAAPPAAATPPAATAPAATAPAAATPPAAPGPDAAAATEPLPAAPAAPGPAAAAPVPAPVPPPARTSHPPLSDASSAETPPDQEEPSSGLGLIIVGWIATGVGVGNLALIPTCSFSSAKTESEQLVRDVCVGIHVGFGVVGLGLGIPFLAVGYSKRSKYNEWKKHHAVLDHLLHTDVAIQNNGAVLLYRGSF